MQGTSHRSGHEQVLHIQCIFAAEVAITLTQAEVTHRKYPVRSGWGLALFRVFIIEVVRGLLYMGYSA